MVEKISLATRLSIARETKRVSLDAVAKKTGLSASTICRLESGETTEAPFPTIVKLADYYGLKLDRMANCVRER
jgi:transcriptional regulator with XRE-family HTH domain